MKRYLRFGLAVAVGLGGAVAVAAPAMASAPGDVAGATTATDSNGRMFVFNTDYQSGGHIFYSVRPTSTSSFLLWDVVGGNGVNGGQLVATVVNGQGLVTIFVRGTTNKIYYNTETSSGAFTGGWTLIPGSTTFTTEPVVATNRNGQMDVFAANGNAVYHNAQTSSTGGFSSSWTSLGSTAMFPTAGSPDMSATKTYGGGVLVAGGAQYRYQANPGGSWSAWSDVSPSWEMDHITLQATANGTYATGIDHADADALNAGLRGIPFSDAIANFVNPYVPGGGTPAAYRTPIAANRFLNADVIAVHGTDGAIYISESGALNPGHNTWINLGKPPVSTTLTPTVGIQQSAQVGAVFISTYHGGTYFKWLDFTNGFSISSTWMLMS